MFGPRFPLVAREFAFERLPHIVDDFHVAWFVVELVGTIVSRASKESSGLGITCRLSQSGSKEL